MLVNFNLYILFFLHMHIFTICKLTLFSKTEITLSLFATIPMDVPVRSDLGVDIGH